MRAFDSYIAIPHLNARELVPLKKKSFTWSIVIFICLTYTNYIFSILLRRIFIDPFISKKLKACCFLSSVFLYVNFMLSKLNFVEQRVWLAVVGILSVAMGNIFNIKNS